VDIPKRADLIIASPGGFPRDIDLYQSQKALSVAEVMGRPDCTFIVVAECRDGFGEETFERWMVECSSPQEIIDRYRKEGFNVGNNKAFNYARALLKGRIIIVTDQMGKERLERAKLGWAPDLQSAVDEALSRGSVKTVSVMAQASNIVPRVLEEG
jgi:nickel-dependent lactate racemase